MMQQDPRVGAPWTQATPKMAPGGLPVAAAEGVLGRRLFAYLIDIVVIFIVTAVLSVIIGILGILTLGLGWGLFFLLPATGILYSAVTVGGSKQSTIGMRMMGLRVVQANYPGRVDWVTAGIHALLFYVAATTLFLWLADVVIGVARADRRMGHDLVVGLGVVRTS